MSDHIYLRNALYNPPKLSSRLDAPVGTAREIRELIFEDSLILTHITRSSHKQKV